MTTGLEGTAALVRLILRRDRVRLPLWILSITALTATSGNAMGATFNTQASIDGYATSLATSPAAIFLAGPPVGLHTLAGIVLNKVSFLGLVGVTLMVIFEMARHTRTEEEEGRVEMLRSAVVGRHAGSAAALIVTSGAAVLVGAGSALATAGASVPVPDALLYGASVAALGLVFGAVTLCTAQLFTHTRATSGAALGVFGLAYVVRGIGDANSSALVWFSPIGWSQATHPVGDARWWPLLLSLVATAGLVSLAVALAGHRDVGAGMFAGRPGNARAPRSLSGAVGLALRTQRAFALGWVLGIFVLGVVYGSLTQAVQDMAKNNPTLEKFFESAGQGSIVDSFLSTMLLILALLAAAFAVASATRLTAEETSGRLEVLLATGLSRSRWMLGSLVVTAVGSVAVLFAGGLGIALAYGVSTSDPGQVGRIAALQLVYAPAVLLPAALAALVDGWAPRATKAVWFVLAVWIVVGYLGSLLNPPDWLLQSSPFTHTAEVPAEALALGAPLVIALITVLLTGAGVVGLRRRDVG